jgi:hypothetical protein
MNWDALRFKAIPKIWPFFWGGGSALRCYFILDALGTLKKGNFETHSENSDTRSLIDSRKPGFESLENVTIYIFSFLMFKYWKRLLLKNRIFVCNINSFYFYRSNILKRLNINYLWDYEYYVCNKYSRYLFNNIFN